MELNRWLRDEEARARRFGPKPEKPFDRRRKLPPQAVPSAPIVPQPELHAYLERFRSVFPRKDTRRNAEIYLRGLCSDLPRKNGETMEAAIPGARQMDIFNFLVRAGWSPEALDRARVLDWVNEQGVGDQAVDIIVDETSLLKQGTDSVGVARQYLGCVGKVANGQVLVTLQGAWPGHDLPLTGALYLPDAWAQDVTRRLEAKVPEAVPFRTKPEIAQLLLERIAGWGLRFGVIHADAGYGDLDLMCRFDVKGWRYCLGVRGNFSVYLPEEGLPPTPPIAPYGGRGRPRTPPQPERPLHTVAEVQKALDPTAWIRVPYREDVNGTVLERYFAAVRVQPATRHRAGRDIWLLLERPIDPSSKDDKYYLITAPSTETLSGLARLAHTRPRIERASYENAKDRAGLADYQGRSWPGFHAHLAMVWLAMTWLGRHRCTLPPPPPPRSPRDANTSPIPAEGESASVAPPPASATARFDARPVILRAAPAPFVDLSTLPRQLWESLQAVHRRLVDNWRLAVFEEFLLLGYWPRPTPLRPRPMSP